MNVDSLVCHFSLGLALHVREEQPDLTKCSHVVGAFLHQYFTQDLSSAIVFLRNVSPRSIMLVSAKDRQRIIRERPFIPRPLAATGIVGHNLINPGEMWQSSLIQPVSALAAPPVPLPDDAWVLDEIFGTRSPPPPCLDLPCDLDEIRPPASLLRNGTSRMTVTASVDTQHPLMRSRSV